LKAPSLANPASADDPRGIAIEIVSHRAESIAPEASLVPLAQPGKLIAQAILQAHPKFSFGH